MKRLIKSAAMLGLAGMALVQATGAYFSSTATASDNQINVGTLTAAVDSTRAHDYQGTWGTGAGVGWDGSTLVGNPFDAYVVVKDVAGVNTELNELEAWDNAEPGAYTAYSGGSGIETLLPGNNSIWFSVRNTGSLEAKAWVEFAGNWTNLRAVGTDGVTACTTLEGSADGNSDLIQIENLHFYAATATNGGNCENHEECRNIRDGLTTANASIAYTDDTANLASGQDVAMGATLAGSSFSLSTTGSMAGTPIELSPAEHVIVRADLNFDPANGSADYNCYQGAQYLYDVVVNASQLADPMW